MGEGQAPRLHTHKVQLTDGGDESLLHSVREYLREGAAQGESLIVVATAPRIQYLAESIPASAGAQFIDAYRAARAIMRNGAPDWTRFDAYIGNIVRAASPPVRIFGEMVGVLWSQGRFSAAIRVEEFWNRLARTVEFDLFCGYPINIFDREFQVSSAESLFRDHTHVLPASMKNGHLIGSLRRAMREILGDRADAATESFTHPLWPALPEAESTILWLRHYLPDEAEEVLSRARELYRVCEEPAAAR